MDNSTLKVQLLNWYNFYETCHKVCKKEDNYQKQKKATASLDYQPTFYSLNTSALVKNDLYNFVIKQKNLLDKLLHFINGVKKTHAATIDSENTRVKNEVEALKKEKKKTIGKYNKLYNTILILSTTFALAGIVLLSVLLWGIYDNRIDSSFLYVLYNLGIIICFGILWAILNGFFALKIKPKIDYFEELYDEKINTINNSNKNYEVLKFLIPFYNSLLFLSKNANKSDEAYKLLNEYSVSLVINDVNKYKDVLDNNPLTYGLVGDLRQFLKEYREYESSLLLPINNYIQMTKESIKELVEIRKELRSEFPIPAKYENEQSIKALLSLALDGRCDTLKEAINILEDEKFKSQVLDSIKYLNNNLTIQNQILIEGFTQLSIQQQQISNKLDNVNRKLTTIKNVTIANFLDN